MTKKASRKQARKAAAPAASQPRKRRPGSGTSPTRRPSPTRVSAPADTNLIIVGVGASAGGLEAFSSLLRGLPQEPGLAIVFVQHLAPTHDSALVALLSGVSPLPIEQAVDGMRVLRDRVYVIPPNAQMVIDGDVLRVNPRPDD